MWIFSKKIERERTPEELKFNKLCVPGTKFTLFGIEHTTIGGFPYIGRPSLDEYDHLQGDLRAVYVDKNGVLHETEYSLDKLRFAVFHDS